MEAQDVQAKITAQIADAAVNVAGADCNFTLMVISDSFEGLSPLKRQQKVMACFADELATGALHALSVKTFTQDEWRLSQSESLTQLS